MYFLLDTSPAITSFPFSFSFSFSFSWSHLSVLFCSFSLYSGPFHLFCSPSLCNRASSRALHKHYFSCFCCPQGTYLFLPVLDVPLAKMAAVLDSTSITPRACSSLFQTWWLGLLQVDRPISFRASPQFWCLPYPQQGVPLHALCLL